MKLKFKKDHICYSIINKKYSKSQHLRSHNQHNTLFNVKNTVYEKKKRICHKSLCIFKKFKIKTISVCMYYFKHFWCPFSKLLINYFNYILLLDEKQNNNIKKANATFNLFRSFASTCITSTIKL